MLPQLFSAPYVQRLSRKKPYVLTMSGTQRLLYVVIAASIWLVPIDRAKLLLTAFSELLSCIQYLRWNRNTGLDGTGCQLRSGKTKGLPYLPPGPFLAASAVFGRGLAHQFDFEPLPVPKQFRLPLFLGLPAPRCRVGSLRLSDL